MTDKEMQFAKEMQEKVNKLMPQVAEMLKQKASAKVVYHNIMNTTTIASLPVELIIADGKANDVLMEIVLMCRALENANHAEGLDIIKEMTKLLQKNGLLPKPEEQPETLSKEFMDIILSSFQGGMVQ